MSVFNDNITNNIESIERSKRWMKSVIKDIVKAYIDDEHDRLIKHMDPLCRNDEERKAWLWRLIVDWWVDNRSYLKESQGIYATDTNVELINDREHKFLVTVNVVLNKIYTEADYIEFVRIPVFTPFEQDWINRDSELMNRHNQLVKNFKPKII